MHQSAIRNPQSAIRNPFEPGIVIALKVSHRIHTASERIMARRPCGWSWFECMGAKR